MDQFDEKASAMLSAWVTRADESRTLSVAFASALREADRAAREDCAEIVGNYSPRLRDDCGYHPYIAGRISCRCASAAIRATITEGKP